MLTTAVLPGVSDIIFHTVADRRLGHMTSCFNDWKRFCFVLREIANGENGRPLAGLEAQTRARTVLAECGYTWPGRDWPPERTVMHDLSSETENEVKKHPG
jgi:hypothetical protein